MSEFAFKAQLNGVTVKQLGMGKQLQADATNEQKRAKTLAGNSTSYVSQPFHLVATTMQVNSQSKQEWGRAR